MEHNLELNRWHVNEDQTCFVKPLEELGPDKRALCIFIATSHSHVQVTRSRRDALLLKQDAYTPCEAKPIELYTSQLASKLMGAYQPGERNSYPFKNSKQTPGILKFFGQAD
jgi:hypothetical protein